MVEVSGDVNEVQTMLRTEYARMPALTQFHRLYPEWVPEPTVHDPILHVTLCSCREEEMFVSMLKRAIKQCARYWIWGCITL